MRLSHTRLQVHLTRIVGCIQDTETTNYQCVEPHDWAIVNSALSLAQQRLECTEGDGMSVSLQHDLGDGTCEDLLSHWHSNGLSVLESMVRVYRRSPTSRMVHVKSCSLTGIATLRVLLKPMV
jgi:hypothetical protein